MNAREKRRSTNLARGSAAATLLKHARVALGEERVEDAAWLRSSAALRWAQRRTIPEIPTADSVASMVRRSEGATWIEGMRLLTLLRVSEAGHAVGPDKVMALVKQLEHLLP